MARIRSIKPEFFSHEGLASKSAHARLLAIGLLTLADCEGRLRWVPMQVHSQVFPWEASVNIEMLLGELIDVSYVVHYEVDRKRYVEVSNFKKHQRLTGKEASYDSLFPPPPEIRKKPNNSNKNGKHTGKQPIVSQGNIGNPLGTGEHRNRGTGEQGNIGTGDSANGVSVSRRKVKVEKPDEVTQQHWDDWLAIRKKKPTQTAMDAMYREAALAGISIGEAVKIAAERSWQGFKAEWLEAAQNGSGRYGKKPIDLDTFIIK